MPYRRRERQTQRRQVVPCDEKQTKGDAHTATANQSLRTAPTNYHVCLSEQHFLPVCVYSLLALSQTICVCVCVTGDAKPSPQTVGNIWHGFPRNVLACLWNAPSPPHSLLLLLPSLPLLSLLSRLRRGESGKNGGTHKCDPLSPPPAAPQDERHMHRGRQHKCRRSHRAPTHNLKFVEM